MKTEAKQTTQQPLEAFKIGDKFHIDMPFENERLVDNVEIIKEPEKHTGDIMVYSPYLKANIFVPVKELKQTHDSKEGLHTQGEWKFDGIECILCNDEVIADIRPCNHDGEEVEKQVFNRSKGEAIANAEIICKAVNERQALLDMIGKFCYKLQEHQKEDGKILKGYTLAANIPGLTELLNEATKLLNK